jgi:hypothetical protein
MFNAKLKLSNNSYPTLYITELGATLSIMHHMNHHLDVFRDAAVDTRELHPIIVTVSFS